METLGRWLRSSTSGVTILALLGAGMVCLGTARVMRHRRARVARMIESIGLTAIAIAGGLMIVGGPFNE